MQKAEKEVLGLPTLLTDLTLANDVEIIESVKQVMNAASAETDSNNKKNIGRWTKEEHLRFIESLKLFGKSWKKVEEHVGTRSGAQIRSHAQKFFNRLSKDNSKSNNP